MAAVAGALDAGPKTDPPNRLLLGGGGAEAGAGAGVLGDPKLKPPAGMAIPPFALNGAGLENKLEEEAFTAGGGFAGVVAAREGAGVGALRTGVLPFTGVAALNGKPAPADEVLPLAVFAFCCWAIETRGIGAK